MNAPLVTLLSSLGEAAGLGFFIWFVFRALRTELKSLHALVSTQEKTLDAQRRTLEAMERRVDEAEKVGALYRKLFDELPASIDKYKEIIHHLKDQVIQELEEANRRKDIKLAELTKSRLDEINKQESMLDEIPELQAKLQMTFAKLEGRLSVLDLFQPGTPLGAVLAEAEKAARDRMRDRAPRILNAPPLES